MSAATEENAQFAAEVLLLVGVQSLILVTDPAHMLRAKMTFESFGFRVIGCCSNKGYGGTTTIAFARYVRKYVGLVAYGVRGRYWQRSVRPQY